MAKKKGKKKAAARKVTRKAAKVSRKKRGGARKTVRRPRPLSLHGIVNAIDDLDARLRPLEGAGKDEFLEFLGRLRKQVTDFCAAPGNEGEEHMPRHGTGGSGPTTPPV